MKYFVIDWVLAKIIAACFLKNPLKVFLNFDNKQFSCLNITKNSHNRENYTTILSIPFSSALSRNSGKANPSALTTVTSEIPINPSIVFT